MAFIYKATLICSPCGHRVTDELRSKGIPEVEDADTWPQGPYVNGGGEADCPQHCDVCGVFLENPLTPAGMEYVRQARDSKVSATWREFYGIDREVS